MSDRVKFKGVVYESTVPLRRSHNIGASPDTISLDPPGRKLINKCEHCHRADIVDDVAYSVQEAIDRGWFQPVPIEDQSIHG